MAAEDDRLPAEALARGRRLVQALCRRLARPGRAVVVHETHLSWVVLAGRLAVKVKKPVRLAFVDFSTAAARRAACEAELRLNRRLAPALYRRVVAVSGSAGAPRFAAGGQAFDAVLCMRRFPEDALLSERLRRGALDARDIERLAGRIAAFHEQAEIVREAGDPARAACAPALRVLDQLARFEEPARIREAVAWVGERRAALQAAFRRRRDDGAIRDGHGDLHLANAVVLGDTVTAFDCIEFDPALRRIDVVADIAFMTMDLAAHGRADLAHRFLDAYLQATGDYGGLALLRLHEAQRAWVRQLVQRLAPVDAAGVRPDYAAIARARMRGPGRPPRLAVMSGPAGSGKSTVAARLVDAAGAVRVRSDVERKRLARSDRDAGRSGEPLYGAAMTERTYLRLADVARSVLQAGFDCIVDAAFLERRRRDDFAALAERAGAAFTLLAVDAPPAELARRVAARARAGDDASDADAAVLAAQLGSLQALAADELARTVRVDTSQPVDAAALVRAWDLAASGAGVPTT